MDTRTHRCFFVASVRLRKGAKERADQQVRLGRGAEKTRRDVQRGRRGGQMDGQIEGVYGFRFKN